MNKKITITTGFLTVSLLGLSAIINQKNTPVHATYYYDTLEAETYEDYIDVECINHYDVEDGIRTLSCVEKYVNDDKGRCIEKIYESIDEETGDHVPEDKDTFEWNDNDCLTKECYYAYDEDSSSFKISGEYEYKFTDDGQVEELCYYRYDGDGNKSIYRKSVNTYSSGVLTEVAFWSTDWVEEFSKDECYKFEYNEKGYISKVTRVGWTTDEVRVEYTNIVNEYTYNEDGDVVLEDYTAHNAYGELYETGTTVNTYVEPHKLSETIVSYYKDEARQNISRINKTTYTYDGDETTEILSYTTDGTTWIDNQKSIKVDTDDVYSQLRYYWRNENWELSWGEKEDKVYSEEGKLIGINSYDYSEEEGWIVDAYDEINYVQPTPEPETSSEPAISSEPEISSESQPEPTPTPDVTPTKGFPVGAIIGIVVGVLVIVYAVFFVLWKKKIITFLSKPVFEKIYGWLDKLFNKNKE